MHNCGRCGRPIYSPGEAICDFCRRTISRDASRHADRMNRRVDQEKEMFMNIASPGEEEDVKKDMRNEHYVDTHDASAVWARGEDRRGASRRKKF